MQPAAVCSVRPESVAKVLADVETPVTASWRGPRLRGCVICMDDDVEALACPSCQTQVACTPCWQTMWETMRTEGRLVATSAADLGRLPCCGAGPCPGWSWEDMCSVWPMPWALIGPASTWWTTEFQRLETLEARAAVTLGAQMTRLQAAQVRTREWSTLRRDMKRLQADKGNVDQNERRWAVLVHSVLLKHEDAWKAHDTFWTPWRAVPATLKPFMGLPDPADAASPAAWYPQLITLVRICKGIEVPHTPFTRDWLTHWGYDLVDVPTPLHVDIVHRQHPLQGLARGLLDLQRALASCLSEANTRDWPVETPWRPSHVRRLDDALVTSKWLEGPTSSCAWMLQAIKRRADTAMLAGAEAAADDDPSASAGVAAAPPTASVPAPEDDEDGFPTAAATAEDPAGAAKPADTARSLAREKLLWRDLAFYHVMRSQFNGLLDLMDVVVSAMDQLWPHVRTGPLVKELLTSERLRDTVYVPWCQRTWEALQGTIRRMFETMALDYQVWSPVLQGASWPIILRDFPMYPHNRPWDKGAGTHRDNSAYTYPALGTHNPVLYVINAPRGSGWEGADDMEDNWTTMSAEAYWPRLWKEGGAPQLTIKT